MPHYTRIALVLAWLALLGGFILGWPAPMVAVDQEQPRLDHAAPAPRGSSVLRQTFVAAHNGLSSVEIIAVVPPSAAAGSELRLRLLDAHNGEIASASFSGVAHNAPLKLTFSPLSASVGQTYTLQLEGPESNALTVWAYSLDGYPRGALWVNDQPASGDLRFSASYTYLWPDALRDMAVNLERFAALALPLWLVLFAPGLWLIDCFKRNLPIAGDSIWTCWGLALALSLSVLPLVWLWVTVVGLSFSAGAVWIAYAGIGVWVVAWWLRRRWSLGLASVRLHVSAHDAAMLLILLGSVVARLLAARDLALPAWVDSPHHYIIARVLAETGRVPVNYQPVLPVDQFTYHFGFHALAVVFQWLSALPLADVFLWLGQILNGLMPLAAYALAAGLTGRRRAGLVAAFFVGLVSFFPAYYLAWGRYTQLTGLLILALALSMVWHMVRPVERTARGTWREAVMFSVLAAGLLLTHYRVVVFLGVFVLAALAAGGKAGWKRILWAALMGAVLTLPWLVQLWKWEVWPLLTAARWPSAGAYNAFPLDYFRSELEQGWIGVALVMLGWGLLRRERAMWLVGGWLVVTFALLNIGPGTWLVNNNSWAITLFLPGACGLGWGVDYWLTLARNFTLRSPTGWRGRGRWRYIAWGLGLLMMVLAAGGAAYAGARGMGVQVNVVNPVTVLATADDLAALQWVEQHTPPEAVFLVNGWKWSGEIWAAPDGGIWLWPLTGRRSTLPPLDYIYQPDWAKEIRVFNTRAAQIQDWGTPEALDFLRAAGVTHVFIGARGGNLKPEMFAARPPYKLLFSNGAAWVFEIAAER